MNNAKHFLSEADDNGDNGEASACGRVLIFLSWCLIFVTMPFSLLICFKVIRFKPSCSAKLFIFIDYRLCRNTSVQSYSAWGDWCMGEPRVQVIALVLSIKYFLENKLSSRNILHSAMHWCLCESWPSNPDVRCSTARIKYLQWSVISTAFVLFTENQYKDKNQRSLCTCFQVLTKDSVTVSVDAVVYYRVSNATVSIANVENGSCRCW